MRRNHYVYHSVQCAIVTKVDWDEALPLRPREVPVDDGRLDGTGYAALVPRSAHDPGHERALVGPHLGNRSAFQQSRRFPFDLVGGLTF